MEALENFKDMRIVPFDVPGHKRGRGSPELTKFLGQQCMTVDVNSMKPLDNLCHPTSVIREAEELAAISPSDVIAQVDASAQNITVKGSGQQQFSAQIIVTGTKTVFATGAYSVLCDITVK